MLSGGDILMFMKKQHRGKQQMVCESCKQNGSKFIREINTENGKTNIFLCEPCEDAYETNISDILSALKNRASKVNIPLRGTVATH